MKTLAFLQLVFQKVKMPVNHPREEGTRRKRVFRQRERIMKEVEFVHPVLQKVKTADLLPESSLTAKDRASPPDLRTGLGELMYYRKFQGGKPFGRQRNRQERPLLLGNPPFNVDRPFIKKCPV
jgi:hypothetical protein